MEKNLAYILSDYIANQRYEDIPQKALEVTKECILDTVGVILAASTLATDLKGVIDLVKDAGGKPESSILAFGYKVPAWMAAFANGALCHSLDYDNMYDAAMMHPSSGVVPAALAIAERIGKVSGREFLTAVMLGNELASRMGFSITMRPSGWKFDWLPASTVGYFTASVTAGKLLGFDTEKLVSTLGIALHQAAGTMELGFSADATVRAIYPGFVGKSGVLSALLVQAGITGSKNSLDGKAGYYSVYFGGEYDRERLISDLGKKFECIDIGFKAWPACAAAHVYVEATLNLVKEYDIRPQDIERIEPVVGDFCQNLCQPLEVRRKPQTGMDAKFSIPFTVAVAAVKKSVGLKNFTPEGIKDKAVLDMAQKVTPRFDEKLTSAHGIAPGLVDIRMRDGSTLSKRVDYRRGTPENPISKGDLVEKFRDCASYSAKPISKGKADQIVEMVDKLENVNDVRDLIKLMT